MKRLGNLVECMAAVFLGAVVIIVLIQVIARYLLQLSISWPEELARYAFVWLALLGAASAAAKGRQIAVDTITAVAPAAIKRIAAFVATVGGILAFGILLSAARPLFGAASHAASPGTGIELFWIFLALPVGGGLLLIFLLYNLLRLISGREIEELDPCEQELASVEVKNG